MANEQTKRRKKRYAPGSAYAGDVKPTGILAVIGGDRFIKTVFVVMAGALVVGGFASIFATGVLSGRANDKNPAGFVLPEDGQGTGTPQATPVKLKQYAAAPAMIIDTSKRYTATIRTDQGDIQIELLPGQAPATVNNFVFLARDHFYDGLIFHYADGQFSANAGDPSCTEVGEACRGSGGPGYELTPDPPAGSFDVGSLGMANGSQFFVALQPSSQFDSYTPFGRITGGLDVAERVAVGTKIESVTIQEQ